MSEAAALRLDISRLGVAQLLPQAANLAGRCRGSISAISEMAGLVAQLRLEIAAHRRELELRTHHVDRTLVQELLDALQQATPTYQAFIEKADHLQLLSDALHEGMQHVPVAVQRAQEQVTNQIVASARDAATIAVRSHYIAGERLAAINDDELGERLALAGEVQCLMSQMDSRIRDLETTCLALPPPAMSLVAPPAVLAPGPTLALPAPVPAPVSPLGDPAGTGVAHRSLPLAKAPPQGYDPMTPPPPPHGLAQGHVIAYWPPPPPLEFDL